MGKRKEKMYSRAEKSGKRGQNFTIENDTSNLHEKVLDLRFRGQSKERASDGINVECDKA